MLIKNMKIKVPLVCPCGLQSPLLKNEKGYSCSNNLCEHFLEKNSFGHYCGVPLLICFDKCDTICRQKDYVGNSVKLESNKSQVGKLGLIKKKILKYIFEDNKITIKNCENFVSSLVANKKNPKVLVIGGGTTGDGAEELWTNSSLSITCVDIYPSPTTDYIADGHYLPFKDGSFDAVWIQAVLEHVVSPEKVVDEIHRVLDRKGIVYAETPFMQQVHMGAYDFHRYTMLGHRYLFKKFNQLNIGSTQGPGVALAWSIRYFIWSLVRSEKAAIYGSIPFLIALRFMDKFIDKKALWDSSSGVYFMGLKANEVVVMQNELPSKYLGMQ